MDLANKRNNLLHGTWYVGYTGPEDLEAKEFYISKMAHRKDELAHIPLPRTASELRDLTKRCEKTQAWISAVEMPFLVNAGASDLKHKFRHNGTTWTLLTGSGEQTLP